MHSYAGMIARALEQNRLRPMVVPLSASRTTPSYSVLKSS